MILASAEFQAAVGCLKGMAQLELKSEVLEETEERQVIMRYTPLGLAVGIVPWNFPLMLACMKLAPAVMTGNTILIKPSPFTPYCGLKLIELAQKYLPPGVVQILSGDDNLGPWLTSHPGPAKISFTGSSFTGKKVMESASKTLKRVTLELCVFCQFPRPFDVSLTIHFLNTVEEMTLLLSAPTSISMSLPPR